MRKVEEFLRLMPHQVTIYKWTGKNSYGEPVFEAVGTTYRARVVGRVRRVVSAGGEEKVSTKTIYLGQAVSVSPADKIVLPAGSEPQQPPVLSVGEFPDESGLHHVEILI